MKSVKEIKSFISHYAMRISEYTGGPWKVMISVITDGYYIEVWYNEFLVKNTEVKYDGLDSQHIEVRVLCWDDENICIRFSIDGDFYVNSCLGIELDSAEHFLVKEIPWTNEVTEYRIVNGHLLLV